MGFETNKPSITEIKMVGRSSNFSICFELIGDRDDTNRYPQKEPH